MQFYRTVNRSKNICLTLCLLKYSCYTYTFVTKHRNNFNKKLETRKIPALRFTCATTMLYYYSIRKLFIIVMHILKDFCDFGRHNISFN